MEQILILDTNILIDIERRLLEPSAIADKQLALPAITVAEFRTGIEAKKGTQRAQEMGRFLEIAVAHSLVLDYTLKTAYEHAQLVAESNRSGRPRNYYDLIVAAHAAETRYTILSRDAAARFGHLTGVSVLNPEEL